MNFKKPVSIVALINQDSRRGRFKKKKIDRKISFLHSKLITSEKFLKFMTDIHVNYSTNNFFI